MKKLLLFVAGSLFILSSCGESEEVTNCKIHYCDIEKLKGRLVKGENVQKEIEEKTMLLESTIQTAFEQGHSDINEILKNCNCSEVKQVK